MPLRRATSASRGRRGTDQERGRPRARSWNAAPRVAAPAARPGDRAAVAATDGVPRIRAPSRTRSRRAGRRAGRRPAPLRSRATPSSRSPRRRAARGHRSTRPERRRRPDRSQLARSHDPATARTRTVTNLCLDTKRPDDFRRERESTSGVTTRECDRMRNLVVNTFLTLDGVMQAPGGPEEDPTGGFALGGWSVNYWDEAMGAVMGASMDRPFELVLGRKTYEIFAAHWPHVTETGARRARRHAERQRRRRRRARSTRRASTWRRRRCARSLEQLDAPRRRRRRRAIAALKAADGPELQVHGSWDLIQTLLAHDLIDEFRLWIFPVLVGNGKRLFANGTIPAGLRVVDSRAFDTGVAPGDVRARGRDRGRLVRVRSADGRRGRTAAPPRRQRVARELRQWAVADEERARRRDPPTSPR